MLQLMESFGVIKILIVWNNPFAVDFPLTKKPGAWFA